jgi:hypothetical protein
MAKNFRAEREWVPVAHL